MKCAHIQRRRSKRDSSGFSEVEDCDVDRSLPSFPGSPRIRGAIYADGVRLLLASVLAFAMLAPALSCRTAGLRRAYTALDAQGNRKRTTFFTDTTGVYCIGE